MTINQKLFRQGLVATASTVAALAATAAQAAPVQRDDGPHRYKVSIRSAGAWALPAGLTSFTVYARGPGGGPSGRDGRPGTRRPGTRHSRPTSHETAPNRSEPLRRHPADAPKRGVIPADSAIALPTNRPWMRLGRRTGNPTDPNPMEHQLS